LRRKMPKPLMDFCENCQEDVEIKWVECAKWSGSEETCTMPVCLKCNQIAWREPE